MKFILSFLLVLSFSTTQAQTRLLGGDISLLPTYEKAGTKYIDANGKARTLLKIAKDNKWNAARVRLFVNPADALSENKDEGVCQDLNYITPLCKQIKKAGMNLMLDFHYSDTAQVSE